MELDIHRADLANSIDTIGVQTALTVFLGAEYAYDWVQPLAHS